jgi:hypothetical protein
MNSSMLSGRHLLLLGELPPSKRPPVLIVPRSTRPITSASCESAHERSLRAADALGHALALIEANAWEVAPAPERCEITVDHAPVPISAVQGRRHLAVVS